MAEISNDNDFRRILADLDYPSQRALAARFVEHVLSLSDDERVSRVTQIAARADASADELATAFHTARTAAVDSHNRCGAECDWKDQAGYFVARAALAAVTPEEQTSGGPAWQAAMSSRMAMTCESIAGAQDTTGQERQQQYRILTEFLNT